MCFVCERLEVTIRGLVVFVVLFSVRIPWPTLCLILSWKLVGSNARLSGLGPSVRLRKEL